jgi:hypothetical protein
MKDLIGRAGFEVREGTHVSPKAAERRAKGVYGKRAGGRKPNKA